MTPKYRLLRIFWVTDRFISKNKYVQITIFSENLTVDKVVENFPCFSESTRTLKSEFVCGRYGQNTELDREESEPDEMT